MSLYQTYRPSKLEDISGNEDTVKAIREHFTQVDPKLISHCHLIYGDSGCGKAQPLYSKVLTPSGWVQMGDIKPGDFVISGEGYATMVQGVFPQGLRTIYAIRLDDGTEFHVADNHLNRVQYSRRYKKDGKTHYEHVIEDIVTTDLIQLLSRSIPGGIRVPNVTVMDSQVEALPIHPYLLGVLLGDGCLAGNAFSVSLPEPDVYKKIESMLDAYGLKLARICERKKDYRIVHDPKAYKDQWELRRDQGSLKNKIRQLGLNVLSVAKHIPEMYLRSSYNNRLLLLRGLFDSDGHVSIQSSKGKYQCIKYEYSTSSPDLSRDFSELVRSLGITDTISVRQPYYTDRNGNRNPGHTNYRHHLKIPNGLVIATSEKHLSRIKDRQCRTILSRRIESIKLVGRTKCQCIYVEDPCHTYVTDNYAVTHNTTLARAISTELLGADPQFSIREINFAENRGIETAREIIEQMKGFPLQGKSMIFLLDEAHGMTQDCKRAFLKPTEDTPSHVYFFFCTTNIQQFLKGDEGKALGTRCTKWKVEPLNPRQMGRLVASVAGAEKYDLDDDVLTAIVDAANGSPRSALVALEKIMPITDKKRQIKILEEMMDGDPDTLTFCRTLCDKGTWSDLAKILSKMKGQVDVESVRRAVLGYATSILLKGKNDKAERILEEFSINTYDTGFPGLVLATYRALR